MMYREFLKLDDYPFRLTADARYFYMGADHLRAKAYLMYILHVRDGVAVMTGESGVGKTLVLENVLNELDGKTVVARIRQPKLTVTEFLFAACQQFDCLPRHLNKAALIEAIYDFAIHQHFNKKTVMLVVDEAQHLNPSVLEEIRMLANFEKFGRKIIQVILVGQPELNMLLSPQGKDSLSQMVRLSCHINPLSVEDVKKYIAYRMFIADGTHKLSFPDNVLPGIMCYTGGVPRLINVLCDMMLIAAFVRRTAYVDSDCLHAAVKKLDWPVYTRRICDAPVSLPEPEFDHQLLPHKPTPELIFHRDDKVVARLVLDRERVVIGRKKGSDIRITDKRTSKTHAQIVHIGGEYLLQDLNSTNGTYLGVKPVHWHYLAHKDRIRIADVVIEYRQGDYGRPQYVPELQQRVING